MDPGRGRNERGAHGRRRLLRRRRGVLLPRGWCAHAGLASSGAACSRPTRTRPTSRPGPGSSVPITSLPTRRSRRRSRSRRRCSASCSRSSCVTAANARAEVTGHCADPDTDLLVIDGPLRSRDHLPRALGFIKTHRAIYLPPELNDGRRPARRRGADAGVPDGHQLGPVRLVPAAPVPTRIPVGRRRARGVRRRVAGGRGGRARSLSQRLLPRYASVEYKDQRAPQNLVPIAGLERQLRRRLGDQKMVYRALQVAAADS